MYDMWKVELTEKVIHQIQKNKILIQEYIECFV